MEETRNNFGRKALTQKVKKLNPRVDLSAMVSVSFLLIVFFMLTSYLSKPQIMELGMPERDTTCGGDIIYCGMASDYRTMTLLLGKDNEIICYIGDLSYPLQNPKTLTYSKNSIRKELLDTNQKILEQSGDSRRGLIVMIKPSKDSNYGNLVDVLDEVAIANIRTYTVVDITPEEIKLLQ